MADGDVLTIVSGHQAFAAGGGASPVQLQSYPITFQTAGIDGPWPTPAVIGVVTEIPADTWVLDVTAVITTAWTGATDIDLHFYVGNAADADVDELIEVLQLPVAISGTAASEGPGFKRAGALQLMNPLPVGGFQLRFPKLKATALTTEVSTLWVYASDDAGSDVTLAGGAATVYVLTAEPT